VRFRGNQRTDSAAPAATPIFDPVTGATTIPYPVGTKVNKGLRMASDGLLQIEEDEEVSAPMAAPEVNGDVDGPLRETMAPRRNQRTPPQLQANQFVSNYGINDDRTYDYILHTLNLNGPITFVSEQKLYAEVDHQKLHISAQDRMTVDEWEAAYDAESRSLADLIDDGQSHYSLGVEWVRPVRLRTVRTYALTPITDELADPGNASLRLNHLHAKQDQVGKIWAREVTSLVYGEWQLFLGNTDNYEWPVSPILVQVQWNDPEYGMIGPYQHWWLETQRAANGGVLSAEDRARYEARYLGAYNVPRKLFKITEKGVVILQGAT
jgi:hypothetical protein